MKVMFRNRPHDVFRYTGTEKHLPDGLVRFRGHRDGQIGFVNGRTPVVVPRGDFVLTDCGTGERTVLTPANVSPLKVISAKDAAAALGEAPPPADAGLAPSARFTDEERATQIADLGLRYGADLPLTPEETHELDAFLDGVVSGKKPPPTPDFLELLGDGPAPVHEDVLPPIR